MATLNSIRTDLTAAEVRAALSYDPATGVITWRFRPDQRRQWNARYAGKVAGSIHRTARGVYLTIRLNGRLYLAHRLAWVLYYGEWPDYLVDHDDRDGLNNRIGNLRDATNSQNGANCKMRSTNTIGLKGVERNHKRFAARVECRGVRYYLGTFDTPEEAHAAYCKAAEEMQGAYASDGRGKA